MRARELRANSTDAERRLWQHLRDRRLDGYKFRRQHPVGSFIADLVCVEAMLVVEVDGGQHFDPEAAAADARRTGALQHAGYDVIRFDNRQVLQETEDVLGVIVERLHARHPHPDPLPQAGEGANTPAPASGR